MKTDTLKGLIVGLAFVAAGFITGFYIIPDHKPKKADNPGSDIHFRYYEYDGRTYLAQYQHNGTRYCWVVVAGPISK